MVQRVMRGGRGALVGCVREYREAPDREEREWKRVFAKHGYRRPRDKFDLMFERLTPAQLAAHRAAFEKATKRSSGER